MVHPDGLHRPQPLPADTPAVPVDRISDPKKIAEALRRGVAHRITDAFSTGQRILQALRTLLTKAHPGKAHADRRAYRRALHEAGRHLLAPIESNRLALSKAPEIGWLAELYPDEADFLLPFSDVVGLNSAWQWRLRGLEIPGLGLEIHPYYGTYFPTRFDHLELFDDWLKAQPPVERAVDVGVGAGVLTLIMLRRGARAIHATDVNPNALASVRGEVRGRDQARVHLELGDLFGTFEGGADLVVFNPPWLPGEPSGPLDLAIYYPEDLFERFFAQAHLHLAPAGRVVLLFSSLVDLLTPQARHPVQVELDGGGRFELLDKQTRAVRAGSKRTRRSTAHRKREEVQLWVLGRRS